MGQNCREMEIFKSSPRPWGRVKRTFLGHFGPVVTRFQPFSTALACTAPRKPLQVAAPSTARVPLEWPRITQNGSGDPGSGGSPDHVPPTCSPLSARSLPPACQAAVGWGGGRAPNPHRSLNQCAVCCAVCIWPPPPTGAAVQHTAKGDEQIALASVPGPSGASDPRSQSG